MAILETTFIIDLFKNKEKISDCYELLEQQERDLFVTSPTIMELWNGALNSKCSEKEIGKINEFIGELTVLPFEENSAKKAAEIKHYLTKKGFIIQLQDIMIASIALVNGEKIVTRDSDYTRIPGLMVLKY